MNFTFLIRSLVIVHGALFAFLVTMASVMGVVCILYLGNMHEAPRIAAQIRSVSSITLVFFVLAVLSGVSFTGLRKKWSLRWPIFALFIISTAIAWQILYQIIS